MSAKRLVSESKQSELSVRMTLTTGSITGGGWTFMDVSRSFSRFDTSNYLGVSSKERNVQEGPLQREVLKLHNFTKLF